MNEQWIGRRVWVQSAGRQPGVVIAVSRQRSVHRTGARLRVQCDDGRTLMVALAHRGSRWDFEPAPEPATAEDRLRDIEVNATRIRARLLNPVPDAAIQVDEP